MPDSLPNKKRQLALGGMTVGGFGTAYAVLGSAWYSGTQLTKFHWFNDAHEWKQVDKCGHAMGGYQGTRAMIGLMKWSGTKKKPALIWSGVAGFMGLSGIEVLDGFSAAWGASASDLGANAFGAGLAVGNELLWNEQRVQIKISYHNTPFAALRPDLLGDKWTRYVKDYNGHTHWVSARVWSFLPPGSFKDKYPKWLNLAVGYGASGMLGGYDDPNGSWTTREYRKYYLAFDIDLSMIKTKIGWLDFLLSTVNFVHIPTPALQFSKHGVRAWPLFM